MSVSSIALLIALAAPGAFASGQLKPKARTVSVEVSFSVETYDPAKPSKAMMKSVLRNGTSMGLHVPVGFDGGFVRLRSGSLTLYKSKRGKDDVKLVWVEPGQEQIVFELPLDDLLVKAGKREGQWHWSWDRRPEPPLSPIHKYRQPGFADQASFIVTLDLGDRSLNSEAVSLKIKPEE